MSVPNLWLNIANCVFLFILSILYIAIFDCAIFDNYWKSRYYRHRRKIFLKFFPFAEFILNSNRTPELLNRTSDAFNISRSFCEISLDFVRSTRWHKGKIKFYIRKFILVVLRDRKHRVSSPRGIEGFEKAAYLFEMPILPLLP